MEARQASSEQQAAADRERTAIELRRVADELSTARQECVQLHGSLQQTEQHLVDRTRAAEDAVAQGRSSLAEVCLFACCFLLMTFTGLQWKNFKLNSILYAG